jgi:lactoylglutathione lyase
LEEFVFSHVFVGVSDFERALAFYNPLMLSLGIEARFCERNRPWAGWQSTPGPRPLFLIGKPFDQLASQSGNGNMIALLADSRATVDRAFSIALAQGGTSEGSPGLRPEYHEHYYGAYFRDPDGNKLCVVCHSPQA